ncbi:unnamed protein product, partial [Ectocarpus sp. 8 AP-2014]
GQRIQGFKADGIVGLAFPSISTTQNTSPSQHSTFVQLLQEQFRGTGDLFSVYLTPSPNQPGSMVIFGGYDLDLVRRPRAKDRKHSQQQTTALAQTGSGDDKARRETRSTVGRQPAVGRAHHEVWRRGEAQKASLRGGGSLALKQQQQQQAQARVHAQGRRNASQEGSGSSGEADWGHGDPFAIGVREMSSSGINHGMARVGAGGERGGGGLPSPSTGRMELASEGSFTERRHGTAKGSAVAAKQRLAAATAEEIAETRERKDTGHAHGDYAVGDSDNDHDDDDDEPVIVWTPVVEYRGSLSYWTVQLTGWRTETATDGSSSSSSSNDGGSAAAVAGGRWQHTRSNLSAADGQDGGGHTAATAGIATTAGPEMCPDGCQAIVDTGSSLLVPPRSQYREVM